MEALGSVLDQVVARIGPGRRRQLLLRVRWPAVAGPRLAARARARLAGEDVVLVVADARWASEIERLAGELKPRLEAEIGGIHALRVEVDRTRPAPRQAYQAPRVEPAARLAEGIERALAQIQDAALRQGLRTVAAGVLARRRSRP